MSAGESIQDAIDAASEGDTICVEPGTYQGNIVINTANLTLRSTEGASSTIIDPEGAFVGVRARSSGLGDVTVDGFTVLKNWTAAGIAQGLSASEGTAFHVINNNVIAPASTTVLGGNSIQVTGDGSTVLNNTVAVPHQVSPDWKGAGILLFGANDVLIKGNTVSSSPDDSCIALGGDNFGAPAAYNTIVMDNLVHDCGVGIVVEAGVYNTMIEGNKVRNNTIGVKLFEGIEEVGALLYNHISGNEVGLENGEGNPTADARWNYWGCPDGPDDPACDSVVGDVDYDPWLTGIGYAGSMEFDHGEDVIVEATMLDSNGDGGEGIEVEFFVDNESVGTATTNQAGVARLNLGPQDAGDYEVRAEAMCGCLVTEANVTVLEAEAEPEPEPEPEPGPQPGPEPECPAVQLGAIVHEDGSITVNIATNATFDLVRTGNGETVNLGTFEGDAQIVDTGTIPGGTYTYSAMGGGVDCGSIEVTAIPVFPTLIGALVASAAGTVAYTGLRRRNA